MARARGVRVRGGLLLVVVASVACAGGDAGWSGTVTDSAGIQIIENPMAPVWREAPTVVEELRIGRAEGDPNYQFGNIGGIDEGSDGSIYVLDQQAGQVKVYDANGQYLRALGGRGAGPGELSLGVGGMVVLRDTVYVPDMGLQRVTRFAASGDEAGSFPIPMNEGIAVRWMVGPEGRLVQQTRIMSLPGQMVAEPKDLILLRESDGTVIDTLLTLPVGQTFTMTESSVSIRLFEPEPIWSLSEDGRIWYAMNSEYNIREYSSSGDLTRIIRRPIERKPVTQADRDAFLAAMKDLFMSQGLPPEAVDVVLQNVSMADHYPAFANLMGGPEGTLWVQQVNTASEAEAAGVDFNPQDTGSPVWDVISPDGHYLGEVELPARFTPVRVIGSRIYGIWRDELDVQHAMRVRVELPALE